MAPEIPGTQPLSHPDPSHWPVASILKVTTSSEMAAGAPAIKMTFIQRKEGRPKGTYISVESASFKQPTWTFRTTLLFISHGLESSPPTEAGKLSSGCIPCHPK